MDYFIIRNGVIENTVTLIDVEDFSPWEKDGAFLVPITEETRQSDIGWAWDNGPVKPVEPDPVYTSVEVNRERDRRIKLPKTVTLPNAGTITADIDRGGRENIGDLVTAAIARTLASNDTTVSFRDSSNVDRDLTNADYIAMGLQIMQQGSAIHIKARALKAMNPIPADYADDKYWA